MAIFRKHKSTNYTTIDNNIFKNKNLSNKATGLLCLMLSLPDDWNFSIEGLVNLKKDKDTIVRSGLKELEKLGYLKREKIRNDKGIIIDWEYNIFEVPYTEQTPVVEKPHVDYPLVENQPLLNTNNIKYLNKLNKENIKRKYFDDEELNNLFNEFLDLRVKLKAKNTDRAITLLLNELNKWNKETQIQMINNSIMSSWKSVYPLKKSNSNSLPEWFGKEIKQEINEEAEEVERRFLESLEENEKD